MKNIKGRIDSSLSGRFGSTELESVRKILCRELLGVSEVSYYTDEHVLISSSMQHRLDDALKRLSSGEPIQYILGNSSMCGLRFHVDGRVLIPRPETSELVEWVASELKRKNEGRLLDIGTGSGCIAVTLSHLLHDWKVEGWDISDGALDVAEYNNAQNGTRVSFRKVDILDEKTADDSSVYDVIVSNPPYIAESESLDMEPTVLEYEPHTALFVPDDDPLLFYRVIADFGLGHLSSGGALFFEINPLFGAELLPMLRYKGYSRVELRNDISGKGRFIKCNF